MLEVSYNGVINEELTIEAFIKAIDNREIIEKFESVVKQKPKQVVYTSFNGDFLDYINHMVYVALKMGYTPINPECALGYYLSTITHNANKVETMIDCISLELICDELWLFLESPSEADSYPEGVAAEIMAWVDSKPDANMSMRVFSDEIVKSFNTIATIRDNATHIYDFSADNAKYDEVNVSNVIAGFESGYYRELFDILVDKVKTEKRKCYYISTDFYDIKYSDWVRRYLYERKVTGIIPSQLLNSFVVNFAYKDDDVIKCYLADRRSLLAKTETIFFVQKPHPAAKYSVDFLFDVYYWLMNREKYTVQFYNWREFGIPKFTDKWALTTKEHREVW